MIPFVSLVWVEDLLVSARRSGRISERELAEIRELIDELHELYLFADTEVTQRYVGQVRHAIRERGEATTYAAWIEALIHVVRRHRPGAEVRFLTLKPHLADTLPLDDVLYIDLDVL